MESQSTESQPVDLDNRLSEIEELLASDPARADALAVELLATVPGHPVALLFRGIARRLMADPAVAVEILAALCQRWQEAPLPHLQLGLALRELGQDEAALRAMREAVRIRPDFGDAWLALADFHSARAEAQEADRAFERYIRNSARAPHLVEPAAALREGRTSDAEALLRARIATHPTDIAALCLLAEVAAHHGQLDGASRLLQRCLELAPGYRAARHNYAVTLMRRNEPTAALQECDRLLEDDPREPALLKLKAAILMRLADYRRAITAYQDMLVDDADEPGIWTSLGHALRMAGEQQQAVEAYRKATRLAPNSGEAHWNLANLKTYRFSEAELESMQAQLSKPGLADDDRVHFHFALGKALEDRGMYAESFQHYTEGNRLHRGRTSFSVESVFDHVQRCKALFTPQFFASRTGFGASEAGPIFIVGLPRAGSTLVEQILASHSAVEGTMELPHIPAIASSLEQRQAAEGGPHFAQALSHLSAELSHELGTAYMEQTRVYRREGAPYFIDKMPNNFLHLGLIQLILPNALIIDVRRHPLACGLSLFKHHFAHGQPFAYSLEDIGRFYRAYVELMDHFDAVVPGRVCRVHYEALVENPEAAVRRLLDHCGLPFEETCLKFYENPRAVSTASSEQVRSPIFREGVDHWRFYEPWLGPLKEEVRVLFGSQPVSMRPE